MLPKGKFEKIVKGALFPIYSPKLVKSTQITVGRFLDDIIKDDGIKYQTVSDKDMDTTTAYGKAIIANTAIPNPTNKLLPKPEAGILNEQTKTLKYGPSILSLYLGFSKKPKEIGNKHYSTFIIDDSVHSTKDLYANNKAGFDKRSFVFVDYGMIDSGLAPEGKSVGAICTMDYYSNWANLDKDTYTDKKKEVQNMLIERLEKL